MLRGRAYEQLKQQYDLDRKDYAVQLVSQMATVVGQAISDRQYGAAVGAAIQLMKITGMQGSGSNNYSGNSQGLLLAL